MNPPLSFTQRSPFAGPRLPSVLLLLLAALAACRSGPRVERIDFGPSPAMALGTPAGASAPAVRALVTVVGAARFEGASRDDYEMHLRLRLENLGEQKLVLHPGRMLLVASDLEPFGAPRMEAVVTDETGARARVDVSTMGLAVAPGAVELAEVFFQFPAGKRPGQMHLNGVNLRFSVVIGGEPLLMGASFQRVTRAAYPYDVPNVRVQVGPYDPLLGPVRSQSLPRR